MTTDVPPFGRRGYNSFRFRTEQRSRAEQLPFLDQRSTMLSSKLP
jgi:hypothetical protein